MKNWFTPSAVTMRQHKNRLGWASNAPWAVAGYLLKKDTLASLEEIQKCRRIGSAAAASYRRRRKQGQQKYQRLSWYFP